MAPVWLQDRKYLTFCRQHTQEACPEITSPSKLLEYAGRQEKAA